jgi:hypothetical protein
VVPLFLLVKVGIAVEQDKAGTFVFATIGIHFYFSTSKSYLSSGINGCGCAAGRRCRMTRRSRASKKGDDMNQYECVRISMIGHPDPNDDT